MMDFLVILNTLVLILAGSLLTYKLGSRTLARKRVKNK
jgi:uncharacterized membrane protein YfcA